MRRSSAVAGLVLVLLAGPLPARAAPRPARPAPPAGSPSTTAPAVPDVPAVCLAAPGSFPDEDAAPLLVRELVRQAVLIAGRDELGLHTRDGVLREWSPDPDGAPPLAAAGRPTVGLDVHYDRQHAKLNTQLYALPDGPKAADVTDLPWDVEHYPDVAGTLAVAEPLSRGRFVDELRHLGLTGAPRPACDADAPAGVEDLLWQTTLMAPLSAVQQTHAAIRDGGESPARLGALVRGYADLGQLTRFQWSSIHKALTARSLLYAQRMVHGTPASPTAYYHRAYAFTLCGLHAEALGDLTFADRLTAAGRAAGRPVPDRPEWVDLLAPACRYDLPPLSTAVSRGGRAGPLASLLLFLDVENCGSMSRVLEVGEETLRANPACFRILDGMTARCGVISGHDLTERAPTLMLATVRADLGRLPALPPATRAALAAAAAAARPDPVHHLTAVSASLVSDADAAPAEPSFALAGRILQETNFVHVMRRATFLADYLGTDSSDYVASTAALVDDHPLQPYIQALTKPYGARADALRSLDVTDPQWQMINLMGVASPLGEVKGKLIGATAQRRMWADCDGTPHDLEPTLTPERASAFLNPQNTRGRLACAKRILAHSPGSPVARATQAIFDWPTVAPHADEWAARYADEPLLLAALAVRYGLLKQPDRQEAMLHQLVEVAPDRENFERLAAVYLARGDEARWLSTLRAVLDHPDYSLDHSIVEAEIAWHLMDTGRYADARPYADAALNDSGSESAMDCASRAAEYVGDYAAAERIREEEVERYGGDAWFAWCKRTGRGDLAAAQRSADAWVASVVASGDHSYDDEVGNVCFYEHRLADARPFYEASMRAHGDVWAAVQLADVCAELHDATGRRAALQFAVDHGKATVGAADYRPMITLAKLMLAAGDGLPSKDDVNAAIAKADYWQVSNLLYYRARQLEQAGHADWAKADYELVAGRDCPRLYAYAMACDALHRVGEATELPKVKPTTVPATRPAP
jgi:tetratricopeptide (TPR) repeat protein